jgi:hypothetical protein
VPPSDRVVGGLVALLSLRVITRPRSPGAIIPNTAGSGTGWESDQSIPLFETTAWSPVANSWPWVVANLGETVAGQRIPEIRG